MNADEREFRHWLARLLGVPVGMVEKALTAEELARWRCFWRICREGDEWTSGAG